MLRKPKNMLTLGFINIYLLVFPNNRPDAMDEDLIITYDEDGMKR